MPKAPTYHGRNVVLVCSVPQLREDRSWTRHQLSVATGISYQVLDEIEHGLNVKLTDAFLLAKAFGLAVDDLWKPATEARVHQRPRKTARPPLPHARGPLLRKATRSAKAQAELDELGGGPDGRGSTL